MTTEDNPYEYYSGQLGVKMRYLISDRNHHQHSLCLWKYRAFKYRLDNPNAQKALTSTLDWLATVTK